MSDYKGSQGKSKGKADYIKIFPNGDKLSVHAPEGIITGAKFNENPINNYQASMFDLREGKVTKNTGGQW